LRALFFGEASSLPSATWQSVAALHHMTLKARCAHDEGNVMCRVDNQLAHLLRDTPGGAVQPAEEGREGREGER
jgi:hypothetical protein